MQLSWGRGGWEESWGLSKGRADHSIWGLCKDSLWDWFISQEWGNAIEEIVERAGRKDRELQEQNWKTWNKDDEDGNW